jgi:hypothetical protein
VSLIEKELAAIIVDLRQQESTGTGYVPIADAIAARVQHLEREQQWRDVLHRMTEGDEVS